MKNSETNDNQETLDTTDRSRFIYETGWGMTTDIYLLPIGTKFYVNNGAWHGEIVEHENTPHFRINRYNDLIPINSEKDYRLSLSYTLPITETETPSSTIEKTYCNNCGISHCNNPTAK